MYLLTVDEGYGKALSLGKILQSIVSYYCVWTSHKNIDKIWEEHLESYKVKNII